MKPEKIALFLPSLNGGGAERVFVSLANGLNRQGIHVDMVLSLATGQYLSMLDKEIRVIDFHSRQVFFSLPKLVNYLRTEQPEFLISALENANTWAIIAKKLCGSPTLVVISEHNNWSQILSNKPPLKEKLMFQIARFVYPRADQIVAVSQGIRTDLLQMIHLDARQVRCIYNPVVSPNLAVRAQAPVNHPWLNDKEMPVLISIGRLMPAKDFENLILAFQQARISAPCRLLILGEGPERGRLEAAIRRLGLTEVVSLPGFVENPFAWLSKSDLFVLSSRYEGLPTVLIEAMACGLPVISTDCISGPAEILENGKYGDLVPVGNPAAMAAAIIKNLRRENPKSNLNARAMDFSVENATNAYIDLMERLVAKNA
jgi:glycosyltransferase involved in cell wall biosynthesis